MINQRYVESYQVAIEKNLNHGKPWVCSAYDVDARGIRPEWKGEKICYVYTEYLRRYRNEIST